LREPYIYVQTYVKAFGALVIMVLVLLMASSDTASSSSVIPILKDHELAMQYITSGLDFATGMAFLADNDVLVIEKNKGTVQRIIDGHLLEEPILDVNVANEVERGMLGIATSHNAHDDKTYVFLYYTEAEDVDRGDPIGNRLYRYEFSENRLVNPKLLLDLPYSPGPAHNGGVVQIGPDNNVYVVIGNLYVNTFDNGGESTLAQNIANGEEPDGRGGILRVTQDGEVVDGEGILGEGHALDKYYAYGIRNSFGIGFDPITGNLWDTENGGFDEINLVEPGFNSGFQQITGSASRFENAEFDPENLVEFNGNGKYKDPELDLGEHLAPTALTFFNSKEFGHEFENQLLVAGAKGTIFRFDLKEDRTELILEGPLEDKIVDGDKELADVTFAEGLGTITDMEVGPDGYLYLINYEEDGSLFKIVPSDIL
jgi:aldose sugar dehydrogenase